MGDRSSLIRLNLLDITSEIWRRYLTIRCWIFLLPRDGSPQYSIVHSVDKRGHSMITFIAEPNLDKHKEITHMWRKWGTPQNFCLAFMNLKNNLFIKKTVEVGQKNVRILIFTMLYLKEEKKNTWRYYFTLVYYKSWWYELQILRYRAW